MDERDLGAPAYLTVAEMAAELRVTTLTIRRALRSGKLRGIFLGTRADWRVTRADFEAWKRSQMKQPKGATE